MNRLLPIFALSLLSLSSCTKSDTEHFQAIAEMANKRLPDASDKRVTREKLRYEPETNTFIFPYTVNKGSDPVRQEYTKEVMLPVIRQIAQQQQNKADILSRNVNYSFQYTSGIDGGSVVLTYSNEELRSLVAK